MKNWIKQNWLSVLVFVLTAIAYWLGTLEHNQPIPIGNNAKIDSLLNVISEKNGQIIQMQAEYSELEQLKTKTRVKYRDIIIKVREGNVLVVFEELRNNL